jgi:Sulfotransferase family
MSLTIVVGTGRCGSTMLSHLLRMHPDVLSLDEFWNCFRHTEGSIPVHDMAGDEFWRRLTVSAFSYDGLVRSGIKRVEYSFPTRFDYATGMPPLCPLLARLTGESPDRLYDSLALVVSSWPRQSVADHCRALFGELATRLGRPVIVERTGGSLEDMGQLREMFPEARFVFLHRDGPDAALSMSRLPAFRLAALKELSGIVGDALPEQLETLPPEIRTTSPQEFKRLTEPPFDKERFWTFPIPLAYFGWHWSKTTRIGTIEIRNVRGGQWMTLRYELLLNDPSAELVKLAAFIGVGADPRWLDRACPHVDPKRAGSAAAELHPGELGALRRACAPGTRAFDQLEAECAAAAG